jgi:hypoxanthine phosphoribosyltransferase
VTGAPEVLFGQEDVRRRVRELGLQITADYAGRAPVLISVLKGGTTFLADLFRQIDLPLRVDFMSISAYGGAGESSGVVRILKDLDRDVLGEHVLVVEDIIDTGLTLSYLLASLATRGPSSLEVCTLLDRSVRRIAPLDIKYRGFDCPDVFVVGYGLDHQERYRNIPFVVSANQATLSEDPDALMPFLRGGEADAAGGVPVA